MKNTMVMLFHTRDAADRFCDELKARGFDPKAMTVIGPDDLGEYGRGEHAGGVTAAPGSFLDKLGKLFDVGETEKSRPVGLADFLAEQGLDRTDADYYQREVQSGSTMLAVNAGDRYDELKQLADQGIGYRRPGDIGQQDVAGQGERGAPRHDEPITDKPAMVRHEGIVIADAGASSLSGTGALEADIAERERSRTDMPPRGDTPPGQGRSTLDDTAVSHLEGTSGRSGVYQPEPLLEEETTTERMSIEEEVPPPASREDVERMRYEQLHPEDEQDREAA